MKKVGVVAATGVAAFALGATAAGGIAIATADDDQNQNNSAPGFGFGPGMGRGGHGPGGPGGPRGEDVTGEDAQKAIDAAQAAVPGGTADHVHRLDDGTYRVPVRTADNTMVLVTLDKDFNVTGQTEMPARGERPEPATEEETAKATEAAQAEVPGAVVLHVFKTPEGGFAVAVRTDTGRHKVVLLDANYAVQSVESRDERKRGRGHHRDMGKHVYGAKFKKAEAAALQEVDGTVMAVHKVGKRYVAAVKTGDEEMTLVYMNSDFEVKRTKKMTRPENGRGFGRGPAPSASSSAA